jgi:hypothetical protein
VAARLDRAEGPGEALGGLRRPEHLGHDSQPGIVWWVGYAVHVGVRRLPSGG